MSARDDERRETNKASMMVTGAMAQTVYMASWSCQLDSPNSLSSARSPKASWGSLPA